MKIYFQIINELEENNTYLIDFVPTKDSIEFIDSLLKRNDFKQQLFILTTSAKLNVSSYYEYSLPEKGLLLNKSILFPNERIYIDRNNLSNVNVERLELFEIKEIMERYWIKYEILSRSESDYNHEIDFYRVYNVGQGLLNVFGSHDALSIFDFGSFSYKEHFLASVISHFDYNLVYNIFISHPHSDHYNAINLTRFTSLKNIYFPLNSKLFGTQLITLLFNSFKKKINLLAVPDQKRIGKLVKTFKTRQTNINLHFGKPAPSNVNSRGLLLYFDVENSINRFFTGDVYFEVLNNVKSYYQGNENICCPHHGGFVGKTKLYNLKGDVAVLSYYPGFYKSVPNSYTVSELHRSNYNIRHTICISVGNYYNI